MIRAAAVAGVAFLSAVIGSAGPASPMAIRFACPACTDYAPSAAKLIRHMKARLPIARYRYFTAATDPNSLLGRPGQYVGKVSWQDSRIRASDPTDFDVDNGGSIETFTSPNLMLARYRYVHSITCGSALFAEYDYPIGNVLLRVSKKLTPPQARGYARVVDRYLTKLPK